ncbi:MAG TPA: C-GCAxxG-C-C family protein [Candidatus Pullichristensenella avicola]|nr:C-GCAxxG-C-C family protein [Candidatus Pullichristensenella avicola]
MRKKAVIWGTGRIGRGFAADVFRQANYDLIFWDSDQSLLRRMREKGQYSILKLGAEQGDAATIISDYAVYTQDQVEAFDRAAAAADVIAICVFPKVFPDVAAHLAEILRRRQKETDAPIDVVILANMPRSGEAFAECLRANMDKTLREYADKSVGVDEAIVIRMAVTATPEMLEKDDLVVATNGYPKLYIDAETFKGERPACDGIEWISNCKAWEQRKLYTYNMVHAVFAYMGPHRGCRTVCDCMEDEVLREIADNALGEVGEALCLAFGFSPEQVDSWNEDCKKNMQNAYLNDQLTRVGMDPVRKLKAGDRLAGAALLCKQMGVMPYWLTKAIAYALLYRNPADAASKTVVDRVSEVGAKRAAVEFCGFEKEPELAQLVSDRYMEAVDDPAGALHENRALVKLYQKAWNCGFAGERDIRACAQGTLYAAKESMRIFEEAAFNAATAFSAGMGMCGDGPCGGYSGGLMLIGGLHSRTLKDFQAKDKTQLYKSFELAQKLHDLFVACYGGIRCMDVHHSIYDRAYILRNAEDKAVFEDVGAHRDKCTTVIAMTQYWLLRVLAECDAEVLNALLERQDK